MSDFDREAITFGVFVSSLALCLLATFSYLPN